MPLLARVLSFWRNVVRRRRVERDLSEELRTTFELLVDDNMRKGMDRSAAGRAATLQLGHPETVKQEVRDERSGAWMESLLQDVRYAGRALRRHRGFTAVAALTLALGIGANGAIFSIVHSVLLRELPYTEPDALVMVWESRPREGVYDNVVAPADFLDWRARQQVFESMAAMWSAPVTFTGAGEPEYVTAANVSTSFFGLLGVKPALGRDFSLDEEQHGRTHVVILSHGFWQRRFGSRPDALGARMTLNGRLHEVIGVLPASFRYPDEAVELWYPMDFTVDENRARFNHFLSVFARLRPGITIPQAQENLDVIAAQLHREVELQNQGHGAHVIGLRDHLVGNVRSSLLVLMAAVGSILLIACVNVANLLLARGASGGRDVALRVALGAGRRRIVQQLLVECLGLAALGAVAAVPLMLWALDTLKSLVPAEIPRLNDAGLSLPVIAVMAGAAFLTATLFSLPPATQLLRLNPVTSLKERSGRSGAFSRQRTWRILVVTEVALAFVLLASAGLMTRTLVNLLNVDTGFESGRVLTVPVSLPPTAAAGTQDPTVFLRDLLQSVRGQAGVDTAGFTSHVPLSGADSRSGFTIEGREGQSTEPVRAHWRVVTSEYFAAMRIRLRTGRLPTANETENRSPIAIINRTAADRYWQGADPIGTRIRLLTPEWREVVGIVEDVRHWGPSKAVNPEVYVPGFRTPAHLVVRATQDPAALAGAIREQLRRASPDAPVSSVRTMDEIRDRSIASPRFFLVLLGAFAGLALTLAVVGVYGVIAYTVAQSRSDIGIRMALGASRTSIVRMFVTQGIGLTVLGVLAGAAGAVTVTRWISTLLFGVTPTDVSTFAAAGVVMAIVAGLACYVPAQRAARLDPLVALRHE